MITWVDVNARARGLATHLLSPAQLESLSRSADVAELGDALRSAGFPVDEGASTPAQIEMAARRDAARRLRVLARWCGGRTEPLAVVFEDEDRRSVRALARGAVQLAAPELRLRGLVPTPSLPEKALAELAAQPDLKRMALTMAAWRHPLAPALAPEAASAHPDLYAVELALGRVFAARALRAARHAGRRSPLVAFVRQTVDLENVVTALVLADHGEDTRPRDAWVPGGTVVGMDVFERAVALGSAAAAAHELATAFGESPFAEALRHAAAAPERAEELLLRSRVRMLAAAARRDPLGPSLVLGYLLRLRAQVRDVSRLAWGLALGAPPAILVAGLAGTA